MTAAPALVPPPLAQFIADQLAADIEGGRFHPGERLSEEALAGRFGVSRGPVREALRLLVRDELVTIRPRCGASVVDLSPAELDEMFEMRGALYALAVRLFTERAAADDIADYARLGAEVQRLAADPATTPRAFAEATQATSAFLVARSGNRRLQAAMGLMTRQAFRHYAELAHHSAERRCETAAAGQAMGEAMRSRDDERAALLAWAIVRANHQAVRAYLAAENNHQEEAPCPADATSSPGSAP